MPHLTLEYTANIPAPENLAGTLLDMHRVLHEIGGIEIENCKSRLRYVDAFIIGKGDLNNAFLHLDVRFLEGRAEEVKQQIGNELLQILKTTFQPAESSKHTSKLNLQITVEIRDIAASGYFKHPAGTLLK